VKKGSRTVKFFIVFIVLIASWIFLAPFIANRLIVEKSVERADVILILGGSAVYLERTEKAAEIYKQGVVPKIVLTDDGEKTGWSRTERRNIPYVELAQRNLIALGVPAENIEILKPVGSGTIYEAQEFKEKAARENWQTVLLVTSAYHTRRTLWTFSRVFENQSVEFGIAAPPAGGQTPPPFYWWLVPRGWNFVAGEYVKSFYYWVYY
jgi:uncharacterized SAM-binding protein YcdF (DUF218 family)